MMRNEPIHRACGVTSRRKEPPSDTTDTEVTQDGSMKMTVTVTPLFPPFPLAPHPQCKHRSLALLAMHARLGIMHPRLT